MSGAENRQIHKPEQEKKTTKLSFLKKKPDLEIKKRMEGEKGVLFSLSVV